MITKFLFLLFLFVNFSTFDSVLGSGLASESRKGVGVRVSDAKKRRQIIDFLTHTTMKNHGLTLRGRGWGVKVLASFRR